MSYDQRLASYDEYLAGFLGVSTSRIDGYFLEEEQHNGKTDAQIGEGSR